MHLKDYYQILELEPSANITEIKKAYRKLALIYHPDKNSNDPYAAARFTDIKEAYEVLTDPRKKDYYLQQRWYQQSQGSSKTQAPITPEYILKRSLELEKHVSRLDEFRMDKEGLQQYILALVDNETIEKLQPFREISINREIISILIRAMKNLSPTQTEKIIGQLSKLNPADPISGAMLTTFQQKHKKKSRLHELTPLYMILLTGLICLLIFLLSR